MADPFDIAILKDVLDRVQPDPFNTAQFIAVLSERHPQIWQGIVSHYGKGGAGAGKHFSSYSRVGRALSEWRKRGHIAFNGWGYAPKGWGSSFIATWKKPGDVEQVFPEEPPPSGDFWERALMSVKVNRYERNLEASAACIAKYGYGCQGCGTDMSVLYGERGKGFIHVHHLVPLSSIRKRYKVDPEQDLVPVCPNCHAIIHKRQPMLSMSELRDLLAPRRGLKP